MELVLDLHVHGKFSRAVSSRMTLPNMYLWGRKKGINVLSVADFTHPIWFREARSMLEETSEGMYSLKDTVSIEDQNPSLFSSEKKFLAPRFMLSTEVSSIYSENGVGHRIHNLIFAPNFETAEKINKEFSRQGFNLMSDGRPIFGISSKNLMELLLSIDPKIALIPCHIWTPWFSLYGSRSGYDKIVDCFGEYTKYIFAIETGLSSDPSMNWRIRELDSRSAVSFSDAHSLEKMGREATVLKLKTARPASLGEAGENGKLRTEDITYSNILNGFVRGKERVFEIAYTIEFYPEEGKYHYTGHRNCGVSYDPTNTPKDAMCPVCHRPLTVGVMHRVEDLAVNPEQNFTYQKDENGMTWVKDPKGVRPSYVSLVPLLEILSEALGSGSSSMTVVTVYDKLIEKCGSEHEVLFRSPLDLIREAAGAKVAEGIEKVRNRNIVIKPGFDGEYGKVAIWNDQEPETEKKEESQMGLGF